MLSSAAVGAGAMAGIVSPSNAADRPAGIPSITIPKEIIESLHEKPKPGSFEGRGMSGAEVFAKLCLEENLAALFCCPGNYTVINAIAAAGIPAYGGRVKVRCVPPPTDFRGRPVRSRPVPAPKVPASPT